MWKLCLLLALPALAQFHLDSAAPGAPTGLGTNTVTIATALSVNEGESTAFSVSAPNEFDLLRAEWRLDGQALATTEGPSYTFAADFATVQHPARQSNHSISVTVFDAAGGTATATWSGITVMDVDRAPSAPSIGVSPASPGTGDTVTAVLLAQALDPDGDAISHSTRWQLAEAGDAPIDSTTLDPSHTNYPEEWQLSMTVSTNPYGDGPVAGPTATHTLSIANSAPTAQALAPISAIAGRAVSLSLGGSDPDQHSFTIMISRPPSQGSLEADGDVASDFLYTPAADFAGSDDFAFFLRDSLGAESATETVTIVVEGWEFLLHIGALPYRIGMHSGASGPQADIRPIADSAEFAISHPGGDVTWDPSSVPALGLRIVLPTGPVAMTSTESATLPAGEFTIRYGYENYALQVHRGWNLISLPVQPADSRPSVVFPGMGILTWGSDQHLARAESIQVGQGYFLHHPRAAGSIIVRGLPSTTPGLLHDEWNMTGPGGPLFESTWTLSPRGYRRSHLHQEGRAVWTYNAVR
jgi:hypothetical protein